MEQTNKVGLETSNEYAVNVEAKPEAFLSAIEDMDATNSGGDMVSLNTSLSKQTMNISLSAASDSGYVSSDAAGHYETQSTYTLIQNYADILMLTAAQKQ